MTNPPPSIPLGSFLVPAAFMYDREFAPAARDTILQLLGMARGTELQTSMEFLTRSLGKSQATLYGHLAYARSKGIEYSTANDGTLKVDFTKFLENFSRILEEPDPNSRILESGVYIESLNTNKTQDIFINSDFQNSGKAKRAITSKKSHADPRTSHPAIQCVKSITSRYPPKELYDDIIHSLGENPDRQRLAACRKEWVSRGYNPNSWNWLLDWYAKGCIPAQYHGGNGKNAPPPPVQSRQETPDQLEARRKLAAEGIAALKRQEGLNGN